MAIDFPNAPTIGQSFTSGNQTWVWDGVAWAVTDSPVPNAADYVLRSGDVMTGQLQVPSLLVNVDASVAGKLILAGDPTQPLQAATKAYVDTLRADADGRYLKLTGGTLTGNLVIAPPNAAVNNSLALWRFDGTKAAVLYREYTNDHILLLRYDTNGTTIQTSLRLLPTDITAVGMAAAPPAADSLMTMGRSDARFARYRDDWVTGSYPAWNIVNHHGGTWISTTTTSQEPGPAATQWDALGGASGAYVGATPPTNPVAGQLWYCTVAPVGLFVWFVDVDSGQWVSTDGSGGISQESADGRYLALTGGTLTGMLSLAASDPTLPTHAVSKAYADATYFPMAGGTVTTGFTSSNTQPHFTLYETDAGANLKSWRIWSVSGRLDIHPRTDGNSTGSGALSLLRSTSNLTDAQLTGGPLIAPTANSLMTMARSDARYLQLTGGTLTGGITIAPPGATDWAAILLRRGGPTAGNAIQFQDVDGSARWIIQHNPIANGDFVVSKFDAAGAFMTTPLQLTYGGDVFLTGSTKVQAAHTAAWSILMLRKTATAMGNVVQFQDVNAISRWTLTHANGADSAFAITRADAAGAYQGTPLNITSAGVITIAPVAAPLEVTHTVKAMGYIGRTGVNGAYSASCYNLYWSGGMQLWNDATNLGNLTYTSDYRIKKDITPLWSTWEVVKGLRPVSYTQADYQPPEAEPHIDEHGNEIAMFQADDVERWGFVAHELQEDLIPSAATGTKDEANLIQSPNPWTLLAALTGALQEAMMRIEQLEAQAS